MALGDIPNGVASPLWQRLGCITIVELCLPLPLATPRDRNFGRRPESLPSLWERQHTAGWIGLCRATPRGLRHHCGCDQLPASKSPPLWRLCVQVASARNA